MEVSHALLLHLTQVMTAITFKKNLLVITVEVKRFVRRVIRVDALATRSIYNIINK